MKMSSLCKVLGSGAAIFSALALNSGVAHAQQQPGFGYPPPNYSQPQAPAYQQPYDSPQYQYPPGSQPGYGYQQAPSYAPPPDSHSEFVSPLEFLPTFGRRFGQMFRKVFYGDDAQHGQGYDAPQNYQGNQSDYSLDNPPPYGSHYGAQGPQPGINVPPQYDYPQRYETPPNTAPHYERPPVQPQAPVPSPRQQVTPNQRPYATPKSPTVTEKKKNPATPSKKYTPPSITRNVPSEPKVQSQPPEPKAPSPPKEREKTKTSDAPAGADYNFYPLPGSKPTAEKNSPPSTTIAQDSGSGASPSKSAGTAGTGNFLKGKRTNKEGRVVSPYPPYQELDVTGLSSGSLALDPTTQKVFEVP